MDNQKMLRAMFQEATIGILVANSQGEIIQVNPFLEQLFGYEKDELINKKIEVLLPDSYRQRHVNHRQNYHKNPVPRTMGANLELYGLRKDGAKFPITISLSHMDIDGERFAIAYASDDTSQQQMIKELLEAKDLSDNMSKIVDESLSEIYIFDGATLKFVQVNEGARQNIGYTLEEMQSMTPIDIEPSFNQDSFLELLESLKSGAKEKLLFETIHQRKDQSTYPVEVHLQYSTLRGTSVFVAIIIDISERKEYERKLLEYSDELELKVIERTTELKESETNLLEAQKTAKMGHWEFDFVDNKITWSDQIYHNFGIALGTEINFDLILNHIHQDDLQKIEALVSKIQKTGQPEPLDFRIIMPQNEIRYLFADGKKMTDKKNPASRKMRGIIQEVTELKKAEIAIKESENKLKVALEKERELNELKSRFVSMASHEFRTPLSTILSSANLIGRYEKTEQHEKREKHVNRIESSVRNLTMILNDFLSLEKLESGKVSVNPVKLEVTDFIQQIIEEVNLTAKGHQKIIHNHIGKKEFYTDEHLLKNILINLLSNGIKYSKEDQNVELQTEKSNGKIKIQVKDFGIGIPAADQKNMFSRFFRANNVTNIQGTGLGLTIVKRYLDLMEGKIWFESEEEKGTTFFVEIPENQS
jgi:PAS domain S-box